MAVAVITVIASLTVEHAQPEPLHLRQVCATIDESDASAAAAVGDRTRVGRPGAVAPERPWVGELTLAQLPHSPSEHGSPSSQALPHSPQFRGSLCVSVQLSPH